MRLLPILIVFCLFHSCATSKKVKPLPDRSHADVIQSLLKRNIDFQWFYGKMSTSLESPEENVSGSMVVRMKKDSVLWVAIKKFGIEAARLLVDKDKYTIIYRLESVYQSGSISKINDLIAVTADFEDLQQLMFGNVILPEDSQTTFSKDSIYYVVQTKVDGIILDYYVNGYTLELEKMQMTDKMNRVAHAEYGDYRELAGFGKVSYDRTFSFPYNDVGTATINMKFSEIEINVPKEIKFSIPEHYEKIN